MNQCMGQFVESIRVFIRGGDSKMSGIVTKIYLKYLYKFETLVPLKILSLWLDTAIPAKLPLLGTLSKIFSGKDIKGRQLFSLNLCKVSKTPLLQNLLHPWVQKSRKEWARVSRGGGHHHLFVFSQKLFDASLSSAYSVFKIIAKHACRHLEKIPEKWTRSTQRNVTWQTDLEHRRFPVPSGRTLKYVSFVWKI